MTAAQKEKVKELLGVLQPTAVVHGDCVGADEDFDEICKELNIHIMVRPCSFAHLRAFCKSEVIAECKDPMTRNRDIVAQADVMIACPPNRERIKRGSGTWATIGFAERSKTKLYVVFPSGVVRP